MKNNKGYSPILILIIILIFAIVIGISFFFFKNQNKLTRNTDNYINQKSINVSKNESDKDKNLDKSFLTKKVYLLVFNPKIANKGTIEHFSWNNPEALSLGVANFFREVTGNKLSYSIVKKQIIEVFPQKEDGFVYNSSSYLNCMNSSNKDTDCHQPDTASYLEILRISQACELLNSGEIDELWMWGGPYFGFWESNVAGPKGFFVNSSPTEGSTCKKILPIMGFNYERGLNEAVHDFGHRAESIMKEVYGTWTPESTHGWNKFSLLDKDVKGKAGCGNTHFTPGSTQDYQYDPSQNIFSNCHEFKNFPNIKGEYKLINCSVWDCDELKFYKYWWSNLPQNDGKYYDNYSQKEILNNWLFYIFDFTWRN